MDSVHAQLLYSQQLSTYGLLFIALLAFLGVCATAWAVWVTRGIAREAAEARAEAHREVAELIARMDERLERMSHYLFVRLGPAEPK